MWDILFNWLSPSAKISTQRALRIAFPVLVAAPLLWNIGAAEWASAQLVLAVGVALTLAAAIVGMEWVGALKQSAPWSRSPLRSALCGLAVAGYFVFTLAEDSPQAWLGWVVLAAIIALIAELQPDPDSEAESASSAASGAEL